MPTRATKLLSAHPTRAAFENEDSPAPRALTVRALPPALEMVREPPRVLTRPPRAVTSKLSNGASMTGCGLGACGASAMSARVTAELEMSTR